ncbi:major facilitator superfamily domain-containing protein [Aspergillus cavernicola]|uniref:Major facilitator superfamily domain-containing protein n=1 Tax=Aspergillus cavernicola TaxID=176166 RepID=A0ABR4ICJ2_9EURO
MLHQSEASQVKLEEEEILYIGHLKFSLIFIGLCLSVFQVVLDEVVLGTAVVTITDEFQSLQDIGWYGSAYLFTNCAFQLVFGCLYSMCPVKIIYLAALILFEIGSIIRATAPNSIALILGGIISGTTWRWIFYINPILSAPTFLIIVFMLKFKPPTTSVTTWKEKIARLDLPTFTLFLASILNPRGKLPRIIILFILFGVLMGVFMAVQTRKGDEALVPMRILKRRSIAFGMFFSFCTSGTGFILEYYLPTWLQVIKDLSVISSAVKLLPIIAAAVVFTTLSGILTPVIGHYIPFIIIASALLSVGMGLLSTLEYTSPVRDVLGYQVPAGVGLGCALQQTLVAAQTILPMNDIPIGVSLIVLAQTLGGTIIDKSAVLNAGNREIRNLVPAEDLSTIMDLCNQAIVNTWYLSIALAAALIIGVLGMEWKRVTAAPQK